MRRFIPLSGYGILMAVMAASWLVILVLGVTLLLLGGARPGWMWTVEVGALLITGLVATLLSRFMLRERRKAEQALSESEDRFSSLTANIPGIVFRCVAADKGWRTLLLSEAVEQITGRTSGEFMQTRSRPLASVIHPEDQGMAEEPYWGQAVKGEDYSLEYRIIRKDGRIRWLQERGRGVLDARGMFKWIDGAIFDVTKRKRAEVEQLGQMRLMENLKRVDQAIRTSRDLESMMAEVLETTRSIFGSDRCFLLYPCDPDAAEWRVPMERTAEAYPGAGESGVSIPMAEDHAEVFRRCLESDSPVAFGPHGSAPLPRSLVEPFSLRSQLASAIYPRNDKPWVFGMHQCSSPRIWTEEELQLFREIGRRLSDGLTSLLTSRSLRESEGKFRSFVENTMVGVAVLQDNRFRFVNQSMSEVYGHDREELLQWTSKEVFETIHPDDRAFVYEQAQKKQRGEADVVNNYVYRILTKDGEVRWLEIYSKTIDYEGRPGILISLLNVTERKQAQDELAELNRELESIVAERTGDLRAKAEELEAANERLMRLDEIRSALVTTVAHDLRTPLTSVLGFAKIMKRDFSRHFGPLTRGDDRLARKAERIVNNLEIIASEGERLSKLMDDFLDLSRIESGRVEWDDMFVDVAVCLERALFNIGGRLSAKPEVSVEIDVADSLPKLYMDRGRLEQVLTHLLDNAVKFTDQGIVFARVTARDLIMRIEVEDPGVGIPEEEQRHIFDTFHQVGSGDTLRDTLKGTGLGLTISKRIVTHYNGAISVFSEPGRGSRFVVELPVER
ncbi:PAS domain-containing protein [Salidesulfovibrio onnuriiensis]|uniref:PAS domain-containing protein n=1 Tax=Salidesulfovibrio onnuriiensis TaxID=2583823 RepID=UPI0011C89905|nr:PAS domain-containing protein [Salidesulfovibrio onnuriiensis]